MRVIQGAVAVAVVATVAAFVIWRKGQRELAASEALSKVRPPAARTAATLTGLADAYLKVAGERKGTAAAMRARLLGATALFEEGKYADAQAQYEKFLSEYPDSPHRPEAFLGVAACLAAQGRVAEAIPRYQDLVSRFPQSPVAVQAKVSLARLYELNQKPAEALRLYQELSRGEAWGSVVEEARLRIEDLLQQHPALAAATNQVAPAVASP